MNRRHGNLWALTGSLLLMGTWSGWTVEPPNFAGLVRVPPMTAPAMDGQWVSAAEWQAAGQAAGWADSILGVANNDGTQVAVGHAAGVLYVRFSCPISEKFRLNKIWYADNALKANAREKDGDIFKDDYVGVYLTPPGGGDVYFLGVNGMEITRDSRNGEVSWNGQWQTQQTRDDFFWTVGFAIPLSPLGGAVTEDQAWGVNFAHGARHIELLESIWAYWPTALQPMAEMRLSTRAIAVALAGFGGLSDGSLALKGQVGNLSGEPFDGALEVTVRDFPEVAGKAVFGPEKTPLALKPGEKKDIAAHFDLGAPLCGAVSVTVKDAQDACWLDHALPFVFAREMSMETRWIPTPAILQVALDLGSAESFKKVTGGRVKITSQETGKEALAQALPAFQSSSPITDIDCRKLPLGRYGVEVELQMGAATSVFKDAFMKEPDPEWLGCKAGISDQVPVPWTPLKAEGGKRGWMLASKPLTVSCWGRQYTFGTAGFPSQINVLGQDILAGPVRILVKRGGKTEVLPAGVCQVTGKKDTRVTFKSVAKAGGLEITAETWIEFDGFTWNTITVRADTPTEIEGLSVEIPFKKEYATLWFHPALNVGFLKDNMGAPPQQAYASEPLNFMRLGDEEHGIQFCWESAGNWKSAPGKGQELIPGDKEYLLRYNLIGQPTKVDKPIEMALGYTALPCKPRSNLYRCFDSMGSWTGAGAKDNIREEPSLNKEQLKRYNRIFQMIPIYTSRWQGRRDCNYFNFWNEEAQPVDTTPQAPATRWVKWNDKRNPYCLDFLQKVKAYWADQWETNRNTFILYHQSNTADANTPEYRKYRFEWKTTPGAAPYIPPDPKTMNQTCMASVCDQSSWADFQLWCMEKMLRYLSDDGKIPIHGYHDNSVAVPCSNTLHGCPAEGHRPLLADREWFKRVYTIYKTLNPLNQVFGHSKSYHAMHCFSFVDTMHEGEQFGTESQVAIMSDPSMPRDFTKIYNLARYRAASQPYLWGPEHLIGAFLLFEWGMSEPDQARGALGHLWGMALCHDTPVGWGNVPMCLVRAIGDLVWDDQVEFIPYWRKQTGLEVKTPASPVVISGWQRGKANLLVIVFNDSDQTADCRLNIDFNRFGFAPGEIKRRDYGGAGLSYPDVLFRGKVTYRGRSVEKIEYLDPQMLAVQDTAVKAGVDLPVEVKQRSFKLLRFWQ